MKRVLIIIAVALLFVGFSAQNANAQCKRTLVYTCATNNGRAIFLRDFNAKLKKSRPEDPAYVAKFSVVLNKGTLYRFNICDPKGFEYTTMLTLFDARNKYGKTYYSGDEASTLGLGDLVKRNYRPEQYKIESNGGVVMDHFDFVCEKSGVYFVSIQYREGYTDNKGCAVGIMSFVGKNK
ncbi:MAG: hypothetical protein KAI79_05695 [Bacteroidales bacterium]|nr:hypothetical protein [Bacteroidales bacterium]